MIQDIDELIFALEKQYENDTLFYRLIRDFLINPSRNKCLKFFEELAIKINKQLVEEETYFDNAHEVQEAALPYILGKQNM